MTIKEISKNLRERLRHIFSLDGWTPAPPPEVVQDEKIVMDTNGSIYINFASPVVQERMMKQMNELMKISQHLNPEQK